MNFGQFMGGMGGGDEEDFGGFPGFGGGGMPGMGGAKKKVDNSKLYDLLGVAKEATPDEIKKVFRKRSIQEHPDKGGDPAAYQELSAAHDVLKDPKKRKEYDQYGQDFLDGKTGGGGDPFGGMFGGRGGGGQQQKKQVKPVMEKIDVTLEELYNGHEFSIEVERQGLCTGCDGIGGSDASAVRECGTCDGQGVQMKMQQLGPGMYTQARVRCSDCGGEGELMDKKKMCKQCKGKKVERQKKQHKIELDKGVPNGEKIMLHGKGHQVPDADVEDGDLIIVVQLKKHAQFKRKGADLFLTKEITLLQALTGVDISIKHLDGRNVRIQTSPGQIIEPDSTMTASGLGMPFHKRAFVFGNLFIKFDVKFPKVLDAKSMEFVQTALTGQKQQATTNKAASTKADAEIKLTKFSKEQENTHAQGGQEGDSSDEEEQQQHAHGGHPHMQAGPGGCQQQ